MGGSGGKDEEAVKGQGAHSGGGQGQPAAGRDGHTAGERGLTADRGKTERSKSQGEEGSTGSTAGHPGKSCSGGNGEEAEGHVQAADTHGGCSGHAHEHGHGRVDHDQVHHEHDHDHDGHAHDHPDHGHHGHSHHGHDHHGHGHHGHHHGLLGHHHHGPDAVREGNKRGLLFALLLTGGILLLEFVGGLWTNSLALLSDSGHMLSDTASLLLSLVAVTLAARPASEQRTYGYHRFEILAALFNGLTLFLIAGWIIYEAYGRLLQPPEVASGAMMGIAAIGLGVNLVSAWALMRQGDVKGNVNLRSAYLHVLGDALGSLGAILAGAIMLLTGWYAADGIISVLVALLILRGAWDLIRRTLHILMEGTPAGCQPGQVKAALEELDGVIDVHDLHVWTITSGLDSLSCHLLMEDGRDSQELLQRAIRLIEDRFGISHVTIQVETSVNRHGELRV
ncbi:cation efflux transporter [Paenibacillus mucilaginosus 3016]|uniref:Cation efflux transporter n=1 Tax=Paenibacillus mucilaginosus 3016 TaxID=1116391 RepID=H6NE76_9BACL|nr:cation efflux transporter [Paenibacillus mucilaginosus 3016]